MPNDCIALPQAYNPHNHRSHGGSVQRGLSAAIAAAAGFNVCAAADKRYSLVVLSPNWPYWLYPQHLTPPAVVSAQLCSQPAAIAATSLVRSDTSTGVVRMLKPKFHQCTLN